MPIAPIPPARRAKCAITAITKPFRAAQNRNGSPSTPSCTAGDGCLPDPCAGSPALGTECADGSFYIGLSPIDGTTKVYMTSAAHEVSESFDSASCSFCGDGSVATSQTDGRANTNALLAFNATGFDAAAHCDGLNATSAHGHTDWYLPAGGDTGVTEQNLFWAMVQAEGIIDGIGASSSWYWSSKEGSLSSNAALQRFDTGARSNSGSKNGNHSIRCVRR